MKNVFVLGLLLYVGSPVLAQTLNLPPTRPTAPKGTAFARLLVDQPLKEREDKVLAEVLAGNVPSFLRRLVPVTVKSGTHEATYYATPDYLAVGSDLDYFLVPLTPETAQRIADRLECTLPTPRMVDDIYRHAALKLTPAPIPPTPAMTTVPVFLDHNARVRAQRKREALGVLVAGHKKDVVIANRVFATPGKVAIYGWHRPDGKPIQPLYTGHTASWVDYSHGIRLIQRTMRVDGEAKTIDEILASPELAPLLSDEGVMRRTRYETEPPFASQLPSNETVEVLQFDSGVRIAIDRPVPMPATPVLLAFYALPNGNTIEQTIGRAIQPGDDWHFDIQHIGAQTRFLRERLRDRALVVAYLENDLKSWPAWRKKHGDERIPGILNVVRNRFDRSKTRIVLSGHSGGGSLSFGYVNCVDELPDELERIAFLDANYAYETDRHARKLAAWLKASDRHSLCVLAYNDAVALLNGKTFVSAEGGTWGKSHLMQSDLARSFTFTKNGTSDLRRLTALDGRVTFLLKENPGKTVLHTFQVERNGFIESLLSGTSLEGVDYTYLGDRAYAQFIRNAAARHAPNAPRQRATPEP